jgi:hypothetical protein
MKNLGDGISQGNVKNSDFILAVLAKRILKTLYVLYHICVSIRQSACNNHKKDGGIFT